MSTFGPVKTRLIELSNRLLDQEITDAEFFQELMREIYTAKERSRVCSLVAYAISRSGETT